MERALIVALGFLSLVSTLGAASALIATYYFFPESWRTYLSCGVALIFAGTSAYSGMRYFQTRRRRYEVLFLVMFGIFVMTAAAILVSGVGDV